MDHFIFKSSVSECITVVDFLAAHCSLSRLKIKDALLKGAVNLSRPGWKRKRIRKAKFALLPGDSLEFYYNRIILASSPPSPSLLHSTKNYSIWYKPYGVLSQGTQYGDHFSLERLTSLFFKFKYTIRLVHRLDKDAQGLVLLAHNSNAAAKFSSLFSTSGIEKKYLAYVHGQVGIPGEKITITESLEGKKSRTDITILEIVDGDAELDITLHTGRRHQIRKHLCNIGFPLIGDTIYGSQKNENSQLKLIAYALNFYCPFEKCNRSFSLPGNIIDDFRLR